MDTPQAIFKISNIPPLFKSSELYLVLFFFAGEFKNIPFVRSLFGSIDLAIIFLGLSYLFLLLGFKKMYLYFTRRNVYFVLLFSFFSVYTVINYLVLGNSENSDTKMRDFLIILPHCVFFGLFYAKDNLRLARFIQGILFVGTLLIFIYLYSTIFIGSTGYKRIGVFSESYHRIGYISSIVGSIMLLLGLWVGKNSKRLRLVLFVVAFLAFLSVATSGHRAGIVSFLITSLAGTLLYYGNMKYAFRSLGFIVVFFMGFILINNFTSLFDVITSRFSSLIANSGEDIRLVMYLTSLEKFSFNPLVGVGFGMFGSITEMTNYRHPHNIFIEILLELGIMGFILFSLIYFSWIRARGERSVIKLCFSLIFIATFVYSIFSGEITEHRLLLFTATCLYNWS